MNYHVDLSATRGSTCLNVPPPPPQPTLSLTL